MNKSLSTVVLVLAMYAACTLNANALPAADKSMAPEACADAIVSAMRAARELKWQIADIDAVLGEIKGSKELSPGEKAELSKPHEATKKELANKLAKTGSDEKKRLGALCDAQQGTDETLVAVFRERVAMPVGTELAELHAALKVYHDGKSLTALEIEKLAALRSFRWLKADGPAGEASAASRAIGRTMNEIIVDLHDWWLAGQRKPLARVVEDTVAAYVTFNTNPEWQPAFEPYAVLTEPERAGFSRQLHWFALRHPGGSLAAAWAKPGEGHMAAMTKQGSGMAARELVRMCVNDMKATYGDNVEPARSWRKTAVERYATASGLLAPNPIAAVIAVFGAILLFGGFAMAMVYAMKSGEVSAAAPTA